MKKKKKRVEELRLAEIRQRSRVTVCIKLDRERDAKIIEQLRCCGNKQGYIKRLILNDLTYIGPFI